MLTVENLRISISHRGIKKMLIEDSSFEIEVSDIVGFLGESGSGKTTLGHALCGLLSVLPYRIYSRLVPEVESGIVRFMNGYPVDIARRPERMRSFMGRGIFLMPQSPSASLNPYRTIGDQIIEISGHKRAGFYLEEVGLPLECSGLYPHQLSGGMKQRVLIAMARALKPRLLIADEPTEGLDIGAKSEMLRLLLDLVRKNGTTILIMTHDIESLAMLEKLSGIPSLKTLMLFSKKIIEGRLPELVNLLEKSGSETVRDIPPPDIPSDRKKDGGLLSVRQLTKSYPGTGKVLDSISFDVEAGEHVGLTGPSGSGKTTLIRCIGGIEKPDGGRVIWKGFSIVPFSYKFRRDIQIMWQDPYPTLPPYVTVKKILEEPMKAWGIFDRQHRIVLSHLCEFLGIRNELLDKYPWQLSGGEAQRVSIARCLIVYPRCVLADEPLNGLHLPEKRRLLSLLKKLFNLWGISLLVVSHHEKVLKILSTRVMTLRNGRLVSAPSVCHIL